jgi:hypothetical protein
MRTEKYFLILIIKIMFSIKKSINICNYAESSIGKNPKSINIDTGEDSFLNNPFGPGTVAHTYNSPTQQEQIGRITVPGQLKQKVSVLISIK